MWKIFNLAKLIPDWEELREQTGVKAFYTSKTFWFNALMFIGSISVIVFGEQYGINEGQAAAIAVAIASVVNQFLRLITLKPLDILNLLGSKTVWVNGVAVFSALSAFFFGDVGKIPEAELLVIATGFHGATNIVLRFITKSGIGMRSISKTDSSLRKNSVV